MRMSYENREVYRESVSFSAQLIFFKEVNWKAFIAKLKQRTIVKNRLCKVKMKK